MNDITVTRNEADSRFEAHAAGILLGYIDYTIHRNVMDMPLAFVFPEFEGQGVASKLVQRSLDMVRELDANMRVTPTCPFIDTWMKRHPEYEDLRAEKENQAR